MNVNIGKFVQELVKSISDENTFDIVLEKYRDSKETWDKIARREIGKIVKNVFSNSFPHLNIKEALYIEGEGTPEGWKKPYDLFGSNGVYPDIGILKPKRVSIELDHSGWERTEIPGSKFKIALAKASFGYLSGDWEYCYVFFHNHSGRSMEEYLSREREKEILKKYEEIFHTRIILFERNKTLNFL